MTPEQFKAERLSLGLSQEAMGKRIGVTMQAVYYYEKGMRKVPRTVALLLACQRGHVRQSMAAYRQKLEQREAKE